MKFGPNTAGVVEVIALFQNLDFSPAAKINSEEYSVVRNFNEAITLASETTYGPDELTWPDIKAAKMSEVWDAAYRMRTFSNFDPVLRNEFDMMSRRIGERLNGEMADVLDEVVSDFQGCLYSRFAFGKGGMFFERILESYRAGAWPCGWTKDFPAGRMVAFVPSR